MILNAFINVEINKRSNQMIHLLNVLIHLLALFSAFLSIYYIFFDILLNLLEMTTINSIEKCSACRTCYNMMILFFFLENHPIARSDFIVWYFPHKNSFWPVQKLSHSHCILTFFSFYVLFICIFLLFFLLLQEDDEVVVVVVFLAVFLVRSLAHFSFNNFLSNCKYMNCAYTQSSSLDSILFIL